MKQSMNLARLRDGDSEKSRLALAAARSAEHPRYQPDRNHDHGAEQEITPEAIDGVKAEIPDPLKQQPDAVDDIPGIEADRGKHHADQDRQQDQPERDRQRRAAEKALDAVMGCRQFPGVVDHRWSPARTLPRTLVQLGANGEPVCRRQWWSIARAFYFGAT